MSNTQRMSAVDTTWLRMDRPDNLMQIVGVLELEAPVDVRRLEQALGERILRIDRFRQRVEDRSGTPFWSDDPHFDIARHIRRIRLPNPGGKTELQDFVAGLAATPLDPSRPLWQFHIVERDDGGAALVARIHHAIADGMALLVVLLSLVDGEHPAALPLSPPPEDDMGLLGSVLRPLSNGLRLSGDIWRAALDLAGDPARAIRGGAGIAAELAHLTLMPNDSATRYKGHLSGNKRVAWTDPIALPEVQVVSKVLGCSINDMLMAAVAGALGRYLSDKGDATAGVAIRVLVPINLRPAGAAQELGNRFGIVAAELPVGIDNPLARLYEVSRRMTDLKSSYEPLVTLGLLEGLGYAPKAVQDEVFDLLLSRATAVLTNVPGPREPLYLAGSRVGRIMYWVPQAGGIGIGVSILSYDGKVQFGLMTDAALVPDPQAVVALFEPEFDKLLYFVLLESWGEPVPETPRQAEKPKARAKKPSAGRPRAASRRKLR